VCRGWALGFDFLGYTGHLGHLDPKCGSDASDGAPSGVAASLNMAQPRGVQARCVRDRFLRETMSSPDLPDSLPKGRLGIGSWSHAHNRRGRSRV